MICWRVDWFGGMDRNKMVERTMEFTIRILKFADAAPKTVSGRTIGTQVARSSCSVAANYRAALRGKSRADFINKITIVLEEADESAFWLELTKRSALLPKTRLADLHAEAIGLTKFFSATRNIAWKNHKS